MSEQRTDTIPLVGVLESLVSEAASQEEARVVEEIVLVVAEAPLVRGRQQMHVFPEVPRGCRRGD